MLVLKVMRDVHSAASYYRAIFTEAIRHVCPKPGNTLELDQVMDGIPSATPGEPTMDTLLSGDFLDDLIDEASFFNFWESLNNT